MISKKLALVAAILMAIVFILNVYIGLFDKNLNPPGGIPSPHWYLNWVIAVVDIIAAIVLFVKPTSLKWVVLSGIVWPLVYAGSLAIDVQTRMCLGMSSSQCFPSRSDSINYLFFGNQSYVTEYLWPYTVTLISLLIAIVFILSVLTVYSLHKQSVRMKPVVQPSAPASSPPTGAKPTTTSSKPPP